MLTESSQGRTDFGRALAQFLGRLKKAAVLCGAGISVGPPSGLPTARELMRAYHDRIDQTLAGKQLTGPVELPAFEDWSHGIRFEELMSLLFGFFGSSVIEPLNSSLLPNDNHRLLALLCQHGWPLFTTNFDVLIELAAVELAIHFHQLITPEDYKQNPSSRGQVCKLHGSFWRWDGDTWTDSRNTISVTLEHVGIQRAMYLLNTPAKLHLAAHLRTHPVIVLGYSGTDDFDVSPLLLKSQRDSPTVWVIHDSDVWPPVVGSHLSQVFDSTRSSRQYCHLETLQEEKRLFVRGDTTRVIRWLVHHYVGRDGFTVGAVTPPRPPASQRVLPRALLSHEADCLFVMGMLRKKARPAEARVWLDAALSHATKAPGTIAPSQIAHILAGLMDDLGLHESSLSLARQALEWDRAAEKHEWASLSLLLLGNLLRADDWRRAVNCYEQAISVAQAVGFRYGEALAFMAKGDAVWKRRQYDESYRCLTRAHELFETEGKLEELLECKLQLAVQASESGHRRQACMFLDDTRELAEQFGDRRILGRALHERGIIEQAEGRHDEAERRFSEAVAILSDLGDELAVAVSQYHLGWCWLMRGDRDRAESYERCSSETLERLGNRYYLAHNLQLRAVCALGRGDEAAAAGILRDAIRVSEDVGDLVNVQNCERLLRQILE